LIGSAGFSLPDRWAAIGGLANGRKECCLKGIGVCEKILVGDYDRTFVVLALEISTWLVLE
jgi:hypothetical protein